MDVNVLTRDFSETVAVDADLKAWCQEKYGSDHKVYTSFDTRRPPAKSDCPMIWIYPVRKYTGEGVNTRHHEFEVVAHNVDESSRTHAGISNLVEYQGIENSEAFRKLIENAIVSVDIGNAILETLAVDYENIKTFPIFSVGMIIDVRNDYTLGTDAFL